MRKLVFWIKYNKIERPHHAGHCCHDTICARQLAELKFISKKFKHKHNEEDLPKSGGSSQLGEPVYRYIWWLISLTREVGGFRKATGGHVKDCRRVKETFVSLDDWVAAYIVLMVHGERDLTQLPRMLEYMHAIGDLAQNFGLV